MGNARSSTFDEVGGGAGRTMTASADAPGAADSEQRFFAGTQKLPAKVRDRMLRYSWRDGCPLPLERLSLVRISFWGFDGHPHLGEIIVHQELAVEVVEIFKELYEKRFPVEKMRLIDAYQGRDRPSMADNNTSGFNCRFVSGTKRYSLHSLGRAVDVNPLINPFVKGDYVSPPGGRPYLDRSTRAKGMIVRGGPCHQAFTRRGWRWGGDWKTMKDYQHFDKK